MGKTSAITTTDHLSGIGSSNIRTKAVFSQTMSECMLKKLLFAVKRRRKVNHSSSHAVYSGIEEQSRLMDGGGRKSGIKRPIQTAAKRRFCLTLRASERARLLARSGPPLFLASTHSLLAFLPSAAAAKAFFVAAHLAFVTSRDAPLHSQSEEGRWKKGGRSADRLALKEILSNKFQPS